MRAASHALLAASAALVLAVARTADAQHGAAGCRRTDAARTFTRDGTRYWDLRRPVVFRCTLRAGGPVRRVVLVGDSVYGAPEVLRIEGSGRPQRFRLDEQGSSPPPVYRPYFRAEDLNGDGWTELMVLASWGVNGQEIYEIFRYDPARGRFVHDDLSLQGNTERIPGRPCVRTSMNLLYVLDSAEYCWRGGRWVLLRDERREFPAARVTIRTRRTFHRGRRTEVTVDTLREGVR